MVPSVSPAIGTVPVISKSQNAIHLSIKSRKLIIYDMIKYFNKGMIKWKSKHFVECIQIYKKNLLNNNKREKQNKEIKAF